MDWDTDYTNRHMYADGLEIAAREEEHLQRLTTEHLTHVHDHLLAEFGSAPVIRGYCQGIAIILAEREDTLINVASTEVVA
jgi:hypothetical protein